MKYDKIFRESLQYFKETYKEFPNDGFFAGGALANKIWEKISGHPAVINDLDFYQLTEIIGSIEECKEENARKYNKKQFGLYEDYSGLRLKYLTKDSYVIDNVSVEGICNFIEYKSTTENRMIILDSFDLNCCQVGYDIKEDKFYHTKDFLEFLETGKLKISFLNSPPHTAMRIVKKHFDLNVELPQMELDILAFANQNKYFWDTTKFKFKQKYFDLYQKFKPFLQSRFDITRALESEDNLKNMGISPVEPIWQLHSTGFYHSLNIEKEVVITYSLFDSRKFLFWVRNINGDGYREKIWKSLWSTFDTNLTFDEYMDCGASMKEIEKLGRLALVSPSVIKNLWNLPLSEQLYKVNTIFEVCPPYEAMVLLENIRIENVDELRDDDYRLLKFLSLRTLSCDNFDIKMDAYLHNKWNDKHSKQINEFLF